MDFKTDQERFWSEDFGDDYIKRNRSTNNNAHNLALFTNILSKTRGVKTVIEFGANIGLNLKALKALKPDLEVSAVEINKQAANELKKYTSAEHVYHQSILDYAVDYQRDFSLIKGVLIHIHPDHLSNVYEKLYHASRKYICLVEYYHPTPVEIEYRGHKQRLFKRDFCGEIRKAFPDLQLVEYGFVYHQDDNFPQDDLTWFLLEKRSK